MLKLAYLGGCELLTRRICSMVNTSLEAKIREIIYNDYGVGNQNIESKEIYDKLVERGVSVPENSMSEVFRSLHKQGLIKGLGKMNRDEVRVHGRWLITWVSRYIAL